MKITEFTLKNANRTEAIEHLARLVNQAEKGPQIHIIIDSKDEFWGPDSTRTDWHLRGATAADIAWMMTTQYTFQWKFDGRNLVAKAARDESANQAIHSRRYAPE